MGVIIIHHKPFKFEIFYIIATHYRALEPFVLFFRKRQD